MQEKWTMANENEEFAKSHANGWGRIPLQKSDGIRTFKVLGYGGGYEDESKVSIEIITARKVTKAITYSLKYLMTKAEWYRPESKYINVPKYVVRSVAFPQRQYSKVLTQENTYFASASPIKPPDEVQGGLQSSVLDAMDAYNTPYPTYREALEQVSSGRAYARAFSRRFFLTMDPKADYPLLVYKNGLIGYDNGDIIVCIKSATDLEEVIRSATNKGVTFQ
jgi:hypothetical protein